MNSKLIRLLTYFTGTSVLFLIMTWISYQDGMAYDAETSMGFPILFYKEGVGQQMDSASMRQYSNFSASALLIDLLFSIFCFALIRFLFIMLKRNKKMF